MVRASPQFMKIMERMTQARRAFVGKYLSMYDSFNGDSIYMKVKDVKKRKNGTYEFTGTSFFLNEKSVSVEDRIVKELMRQGEQVTRGEVEHISVSITWKVTD